MISHSKENVWLNQRKDTLNCGEGSKGWAGKALGKSFVVKDIFKCFLILRVIHVHYKLEGKRVAVILSARNNYS